MANVRFYRGVETYVVFGEDTVFGTPDTPSGTDYVDKVTGFSATIANNLIRTHGIGEGRNATNTVYGVLDVTGTMDWELTDPSFLQYCFIGLVTGSGTVGVPYILTEANEIGYDATEVNTLTLEVGSNASTADDEVTYDGCVFDTTTISCNIGETVKVSANWIGRTANSSTTILTYTKPANRPLTFVDGAVTVGSDTIGKLQNISLTIANNIATNRSMGSRLIDQPVAGIRRYDFTFNMRYHFDDNTNVLSGLEARGIVFSGVTTATTPIDVGEPTAAFAVSFDLVEGSSSGDRVVNFDLANCFFDSYSTPVELEGGVREITINGHGLSGVSSIPLKWWTI